MKTMKKRFSDSKTGERKFIRMEQFSTVCELELWEVDGAGGFFIYKIKLKANRNTKQLAHRMNLIKMKPYQKSARETEEKW